MRDPKLCDSRLKSVGFSPSYGRFFVIALLHAIDESKIVEQSGQFAGALVCQSIAAPVVDKGELTVNPLANAG